MALTPKGQIALAYIKKYFPKGQFSAKDLSDACGEKIVAAVLTGVANNGYIVKHPGTPVMFEAIDELEELLIMSDIDLRSVDKDDDFVEVLVAPEALDAAKDVLNGEGITEFEKCEKSMIPNDYITLEGEDLEKFKQLLDMLDECEDVQAVYHNVDNA